MVQDDKNLKCRYCGAIFTSTEQMHLHEKECQICPVQCPLGCKTENLTRKDIKDHLEEGCPKTMDNKHRCPFDKFGCQFSAHDQRSVIDHVTDDKATLYAHLAMLCEHSKLTSPTTNLLSERLNNVESDLDRLNYIYGPHYVWRIDDFRRRFNDAKAGAKSTIYSPAFLTGRHGYKMAVSACLYGDGRVRGKCMSLFVCLCRGDYDSLLQWPFQYRVTFTLLDQNRSTAPNQRRHLTYALKPNLEKEAAPFLCRPSTERNASFGAQAFCDVAKVAASLDGDEVVAGNGGQTPVYVSDDVMFVKVEVDTTGMAKV